MKVLSVNISEEKGTIKKPVTEIRLDDKGVVGDAHAGAWHRQVSLLSREIVEEFEKEMGREIKHGEFAENLTLQGVDLRKVSILDRLTIGDAELEVTQIGKACHGEGCAIFKEVGKCVMPKEGIFCRVINGGTVKAGDDVGYVERPFRISVITVSDRASRGEYEDQSGPHIRSLLEAFYADKRWHVEMASAVIPDDAEKLRECISGAKATGVDLLITTGGTGVGPRDITPDIVAGLVDKQIPGIMEHIRLKFGADKPNALLSRGIAGIAGKMLVYTLPGSVKAVEEYMGEITKTLEHLVFMAHGLDAH
jgi:molybdenum cofactor synthesis domain-containing protein